MLEVLEELEAIRSRGIKTPLDNVTRIVVIVVNSLSVPVASWDKSERPPGSLALEFSDQQLNRITEKTTIGGQAE